MKNFIKFLLILILTINLLISGVYSINYTYNDETNTKSNEEMSDPLDGEDSVDDSDDSLDPDNEEDNDDSDPSDNEDSLDDSEDSLDPDNEEDNGDIDPSDDEDSLDDSEDFLDPDNEEDNSDPGDNEDSLDDSEDFLDPDNEEDNSDPNDDEGSLNDSEDSLDPNNEEDNDDSDPSVNEDSELDTEVEEVIEEAPKTDYLIDKLNTKNLWSHKTIYLTFDDGPSWVTESILNILKENNIKSTFFVIGNSSDYGKTLLKRMVNEGHSIGNHTYSHDYSYIYKYSDNFFKDLRKNENIIYKATGTKPKIVRLPGGSNNNVHKKYTKEEDVMMTICNKLERRGYAYFDWNSTSGDASPIPATVDQIIENALRGINRNNNAVVLFHDTASKVNTLKSLPILIEKLKFLGCNFEPLTKNSPSVQFLKTTNKGYIMERQSQLLNKYITVETF